MGTTHAEVRDGRHQRSEKNREAMVRAALELIRETGRQPTAEEVAERAGLSRRTVFRLFEDMESLHAAAAAYQQTRVRERFPTPNFIAMQPPERIEALVGHVASVYEFLTPVRRHAESLRADNEHVDRTLRAEQRKLGSGLAALFDDVLRGCDAQEREAALQAVELLLSWQSWHTLRERQRCSVKLARRTLQLALERLLLRGRAQPASSLRSGERTPRRI